jgi:hypothetical protein
MGADKKPSGFAGQGCDERSCPSFLSDPDWGKCDERPQGLVRAGPTGSCPSFSKLRVAPSPSTTGSLPCNDSTVGRGNSSPPGFASPPPARWVGLAVGCRVAANAGLAALPCCDHAAAVRTSVSGEYPNSFGDSICPCRALAGPRRWAIIPFVSGGLEVTSRMRAVGRTQPQVKPITPESCQSFSEVREDAVFGKIASGTDYSTSDYSSPTFPQLGSAAEQYWQLLQARGGTVVVLRFRALSECGG